MSMWGDQYRMPMSRMKIGGTPSASVFLRGDASWAAPTSPSGGLVYVNTTVPSGNTVASSTSEVAFSSSYTIPAGTLAVGNVIRVKMYGVYGTTILAPTLEGKVKLGGVLLLDTGALTCIANLTNAGWSAEALIVVTAIGASGSVEAQGYAEFATAATTGLSVNIDNTAVIGSIDTTGSLALTATAQWSASSSANTITLRQMTVEILKTS